MPPPTTHPMTAAHRAKLDLAADLAKADRITDALIDLINSHVCVLSHPQAMHVARRLGEYFRPITDPNHPAYEPPTPSKDRPPCPASPTTPPTTSTATSPAAPSRAPAPAGGSRSRSPATTAGLAPKP